MLKVKDLLKHDLPPTYQDAQMRRDHTLGSLKHQDKHITDHVGAWVEQNGKLHTVDSKKAHSEAQKMLDKLDSLRKDIEATLHKKGC